MPANTQNPTTIKTGPQYTSPFSRRPISFRQTAQQGINPNVFTHMIKSSRQKCFPVGMFPTVEKAAYDREKKWPMMMLESGQITRVSRKNLKILGEGE